jgi:F-type H+-transporting ATPase subunit delta
MTNIMKVSNAQYAQALYEATKGKSHDEINSVIADFLKVLVKNNKLKNVNQIVKKFEDVWNREEGIVEAKITSREKLSSQLVDQLNSFIKDKYRAKEILINNVIDEKIKGGIIIQVGDEVLDGSVAGQLKNLKSILTK